MTPVADVGRGVSQGSVLGPLSSRANSSFKVTFVSLSRKIAKDQAITKTWLALGMQAVAACCYAKNRRTVLSNSNQTYSYQRPSLISSISIPSLKSIHGNNCFTLPK